MRVTKPSLKHQQTLLKQSESTLLTHITSPAQHALPAHIPTHTGLFGVGVHRSQSLVASAHQSLSHTKSSRTVPAPPAAAASHVVICAVLQCCRALLAPAQPLQGSAAPAVVPAEPAAAAPLAAEGDEAAGPGADADAR